MNIFLPCACTVLFILIFKHHFVAVLQTRDPEARDEGVLREVQRSHLREARETRHHDPTHQQRKHRSSAG